LADPAQSRPRNASPGAPQAWIRLRAVTTSNASPADSRDPLAGGFTLLEGVTLSVLLAIASIELVGYRYGDSNQGITVPILKSFIDPSLYRLDAMVATAERFPTIFHRLLGALLPGTGAVPAAFFALYVASIAGAYAGVYRIGRYCGGPAAGLLAMLIAIPVRVGMAGEALYRVQFSHSHIASALVIWAIAWFLEGRRLLPLLVLSLGAYNHLLYSAYLLVPCLLVVLVERKEAGTRRTFQRIAAGIVPLLPLAVWVLSQRAPMTRGWLELLRLRSSFHSFPSYFGDSLPAAAFLLALGALSLSRQPAEKRRLLMLFLLAFAALFVLGTIFTEALPLKAVLQFQPHRCWRFLMLLLYGLAAEGILAGWRAGGLARAVALVTAAIVIDPRLEPLLPFAVFLQASFGRPAAAVWARVLAAFLLAALAGWNGPRLEWNPTEYPFATLVHPTVLGAAAIGLLIAIGREAGRTRRTLLAIAAAIATLVWLGPDTFARKRLKWETGSWRGVQDWVRLHTPKDAVLVTPPQESGFRVFSERSIVGEWKDGTQQYFDDAFALDWAGRMEVLGPEGYARLSDETLLSIARRYRAGYVVLPARRSSRPILREVYRNPDYVVCSVP
jgi:hypothetical protein